jgi:hypothetical protein
LQLFCLGHPIEDATMLINLDLPKSVKILASERVPSVLSSAVISSPMASGATPMPDHGLGLGLDAASPISTSPPRSFAFGSPLSTVKPLVPTMPYGGDITLTEYMQRLLPLAHLPGTTYEEAAKTDLSGGPTEGIAEQFAALASSSVPPQHFTSHLAEMRLPHPIEGVLVSPERVARFDGEQCQYDHMVQVQSQFDSLPELTSTANKRFAAEVSSMLGKVVAVLSGTKNATLQGNVIGIQQSITNPTFIAQYTTQKSHPIENNSDLQDYWERLEEARALMDSAKEAIDRSVYTDDVRVNLKNVIELASDVEKLVNGILAKLEVLRAEYRNFPNNEALKAEMLAKLDDMSVQYAQILADLKSTTESLVQNGKTLKRTYDVHKADLARKIGAADRETLRLQKEQNLVLAAIDMLGRMYIEHEVERQKQMALSDAYTKHALKLDEDVKRYTSESMRHAERVSAATADTQAAITAISLLGTSVNAQMGLLQQWTDESKAQHTAHGVRALSEAHHTALVKFDALVEIWDSANRSLQEIQPEIVRLEAEILTASQARTQVKVEVARKQKKEYEAAIPIYEKTRDEANSELEHLEKVLFPSLNTQLAAYGQLPVPIPSRNV